MRKSRHHKKRNTVMITVESPVIQALIRFAAILVATLIEHWLKRS